MNDITIRPQDVGAHAKVTRRLSQFIVGSRWEDVPAAVRHEGKRSLLNSCGIALGGCRNVLMLRLTAATGRYAGPPQATVLGHNRRMDVLSAAFLNGAGANVIDYDDTHLPTVMHPAAPVTGSALAVAEFHRLTGRALLHAFILGLEAECRIANSVTPNHYRRGFHITSTCGIFGAATATAKLLNLDDQKLVWAYGNAAAQSAGIIESIGFMSKSISVGNAARNGVAAALFAKEGVSSPETPIEGPFGFARVMGTDEPDFAAITEGLGQEWEAQKNTYKAYPCGIVLHSVIDACLELRKRHDIAAERVAEVTVYGHPLLGQRTDRPRVTAEREAVVSTQHTVAVTFIDGKAGMRQFEDQRIADPDIDALRRKVSVQDDPSMEIGPARVVVKTTDGQVFESFVEHWLGSRGAPMSDQQLEDKFRELVEMGAPHCDADRFIDMIWGLEEIEDAARIFEATGLA